MRKILFVCCFLFTTQAYSENDSMRISQPSTLSSGCDLSDAGINSKENFLIFFTQLKIAAAKKDKDVLADLVAFPLRVNTSYPQHYFVKNKMKLKEQLNIIFTENILEAIANQKIDTLFCRDQGVSIGNGEMWINQVNDKIAIKTINLE